MTEPRGQWSGRLGFILAATGSAIGLGNLWKFPYITLENNGGRLSWSTSPRWPWSGFRS